MTEMILKEIMQEIAEQRLQNIKTHEKYCRYIIEDSSFSKWGDWEKQRIIDMFNGVLEGDDINLIDAHLQFNQDNIKGIFNAQDIDITKYGNGKYRQ